MDDDNPRPAQPKPRLSQMSVPRPVVPEVSLMFDSDDSFVWQPQKPRGKSLSNNNNIIHKGNYSTRFHHSNIQPINEEISDEGIHKDSLNENSTKVENDYLLNQKGIDTRKPLWNSHTNSNVETLHKIENSNSPLGRTQFTSLYSGSQTSSYVPSGRHNSPGSDERNMHRVSDYENVSINTKIKQSYQLSGNGNRHMNLGGRHSPRFQRSLSASSVSTQSLEQPKTPFSVSYNPHMYDSSYSENLLNQNTNHLQKKSVQFQDKNSPLHNGDSNSRNMCEKENIPAALFANELPMKNKYSRAKNESHGYQDRNFSESPINQNSSVTPPQYGSPDPFIYQMMQNQNQQILNLSNALEKLLDKEPKVNTDRPESIKRIKDIGIQTEDGKKTCVTVGVNTDIVWCDLLKSIEQKYQHERTRKISGSGSTPMNLKRDDKVNPESASSKDQNCESKFRKDQQARNSCKSNNRDDHGEVSLTLREIVMTTIQDDPPSPEPSLHLDMQEYPETIYNNNQQGKWSDSPVLGESASMYERNSPPDIASRRQNGNVAADRFQTPPSRNSERYNEDRRSNRREPSGGDVYEGQESQKKSTAQNDSNNNGGMTYYNNVMMNVQQILQSSRSEEESKDTGQQMQEQEADPQIAAVKQQLLHFGISFIDPTTLTSKQNRGILDSIYLPRLQHMGLSVYQSEAVTTSVQPIDATAAKYLTDSQLAAIAAMSPAMKGRKTNQIERNQDVQTVLPSMNSNADTKVLNPNNFSMATRNFLGKYGLNET